MNLQFFGGGGAGSGRKKTGAGATKPVSKEEAKKPVVEPLDRNSQVSKFMDRLLAMPENRWNKNVLKKESQKFEIFSKELLDIDRKFDGNIKQALITTFRSASSKEFIEDALKKAGKVANNKSVTSEYRETARQWKNYLEYHLKNKLEDYQKK